MEVRVDLFDDVSVGVDLRGRRGAWLHDALDPGMLAYHAPNMNAFAERWVRSVKAECTNRMVFFGVDFLRRALNEYVAHYNAGRPHQGIGNELVGPAGPAQLEGDVESDERLGGLLQHYRRAA